MKMTDKHREYLISKAVLVENYCMQSEYDRYMEYAGKKANADCGGLEGYAKSIGYYPITINELSYWTDDFVMYEEALEDEDDGDYTEMEEESFQNLDEDGENE